MEPVNLSSTRAEDFSLFLGGPVYQFLLRVGLIKPPLDRLGLRILVISGLAWAPLLFLTIWNGQFLGGVEIPFLLDYEVHVRMLVSLPLFIFAEMVVHRRIRLILGEFSERQIISDAQRPRFDAIIQSALRLRNSVVIELGLLAAVFLASWFSVRALGPLHSDTWYGAVTSTGFVNTPAGYWYQFVSIPVSQFIALRWYFRLVVWTRLLWQTSKLELNLVPTHPDGACGLGFLDEMAPAMAPILLALSCLLSGNLANRILHDGDKLPDFYGEIGLLAMFLMILSLGPLCAFVPNLLKAKRKGLLTYGRLASTYVVDFDRKWIGGRPKEKLLGSADLQSLADLGNSFNVIRSMVPFPFGKFSLLGLAVTIAAPLLPLTLTMFSLQELLMRLVQIVL